VEKKAVVAGELEIGEGKFEMRKEENKRESD
jgi:hypothetical protein